MMSLYESARRRRVIRMPLQERGFPLELMIEAGELPVEEEGRYDIRGFLSWEGVDSGRFDELRGQGLGHHQIMMRLHEEREKAQAGAGPGG